MKESKVVSSLREAIRLSGLQDGMCVSFHHHLRNGDYVVNMVMEQISAMGIRDLTVNASALFDVHLPMLEHIKNGTVSRLLTNYMSAGLGRAISGRHGPARGVPDARRPPARYCRRRNPNRRCIHRRAKQRHDGQLHGQGRKIGLRFAGLRLPGRAVREKGHCYHR